MVADKGRCYSMLVFLDSSILCTDYYMRGTYFELLKRASTIVLSDVVIDEVKNKHQEMIKEHIQSLNKTTSELGRLISSPVSVAFDNLLLQEQTAYSDFLEMFLIESGMTIAETYPAIEHQKIVQRALQRKKPFKSDGKNGYRDYLVWRSFLGVAKSFSLETACFITLNKRDFSDEKDEKKLHPDLISELQEMKIDNSRIQYWTSLKDFVDSVIKPQLQENEEHQKFESSLLNDVDGFSKPLERLVFDKINGLDVSRYDVLVVGENPAIRTIDDIYSTEIEKISSVSDEEYLLEIHLDTVCSVDSFLLKSKLAAMDENDLGESQVTNSNWNDHYVLLETQIGLKIEVEVIFNTSQKVFSAFEVSDISDYNCPYCPYD